MKDRDAEKLGKHLENKKIAMLVSSGIASYKSPSLIRHLRSYGANVTVYTTQSTLNAGLVGKGALEWATGQDANKNPVITKLTPNAEHLREYDAYISAPATFNIIGKFASGIADDAPTTTLASALGRLETGFSKILVVPTMHGTMQNSIYHENLEKLTEKGVKVINPIYKWGKANLPKSHTIVVETIRELSESKLRGKNFLVTAGPTAVWIDEERKIITRFKGKTGRAIAEELYMRGANVKLVLGEEIIEVPEYIDTKIIYSFDEYYESVMNELANKDYDYGVFSAAVADYKPQVQLKGKTPSGGQMPPTHYNDTLKVIAKVREEYPELHMTTFKYQSNLSVEELLEIADKRIIGGYQLVVANRREDMDREKKLHTSYIVDRNGLVSKSKTKEELAINLLDTLEARL